LTSAQFLEIQDHLADALAALTRNTVYAPAPIPIVIHSDPAPKVKARALNTFDSSDPRKLDTFVTQCIIYITLQAAEFPLEDTQVTFMLSYLKGSTLVCPTYSSWIPLHSTSLKWNMPIKEFLFQCGIF